MTGVLPAHRHPGKTRAAAAPGLQRSDAPGGDAAGEARRRSVRQLAVRLGCGALIARESGDCPEAAMDRMGLNPAACRRDASQLGSAGLRQHLARRLTT